MRLSLKYIFVSLSFSVQITIADQIQNYIPTADLVVQPKSAPNAAPATPAQTLPVYVPTADEVIQPKTIARVASTKITAATATYVATADQVVQPAQQKISTVTKPASVQPYITTADRVVQPSINTNVAVAAKTSSQLNDYVTTADRVVQPTTVAKTDAIKKVSSVIYVPTADLVAQPAQQKIIATTKSVAAMPVYVPTVDRVIQPLQQKFVAAATKNINLSSYVPTADRVIQPITTQVMHVGAHQAATVATYIPTADRVIQPAHPMLANNVVEHANTLPAYVPTADRVIQPAAGQTVIAALKPAPALPVYVPTADRVIQPATQIPVVAPQTTAQLPPYIPTADRVVQPSIAVIAATYKAPSVPVYVPTPAPVAHYTEIEKIAPEPVFTPLPVFIPTAEQVKQPAAITTKTPSVPAQPKTPQPAKHPAPAVVAIPTREPRIQAPDNQSKITTLSKETPPKSANNSVVKKSAANVATLVPAQQAVGSETPLNKPIINQVAVTESHNEVIATPLLLTPEPSAPAAVTAPRLNANTVMPTPATEDFEASAPPTLLTPMPQSILPIPVPKLHANVIAPFPIKAASQPAPPSTPSNTEVPILLTPMPRPASAIFVPELHANTIAPMPEKTVNTAVTATPKASTPVHASASVTMVPTVVPATVTPEKAIASSTPTLTSSATPASTAAPTSSANAAMQDTVKVAAPITAATSEKIIASSTPTLTSSSTVTTSSSSTATPTASASISAQAVVTTQQVDQLTPATEKVATPVAASTPAPAAAPSTDSDADTEIAGPATPDNFVQIGPLQPLSIGFDATDGQGNELFSSFFYNVLSDDNQTPYVSVDQIFNKLLGYDLKGCAGTFNQCDVVSKPPGIELVFNAPDNSVVITQNGKTYTYHFAPGTLKVQDNDLWIREDVWPNLIPMKTKWDPSYNQLSFVLNVPVYQILQAQRQAYNQSILEQQTLNQEYQQSLQQYTQKPTKPVNAQLRYQLSDNEAISGTDAQTNRSASYNFLGDILTGTFTSSGTVWSQPSSNSNNISWNYAFNQRPYTYSLQFGDVSTNASPFTGQVQLLNGLLYQKEQSSQSNMTFNYTGQALPGTQVDVWRGDYLVKMLTVPASGTFSISDPNSQPGDSYRFEYYYPNGSHETKTVLFPASQSFLLNQKQWDAQLYTGEATQGVGVPSVGNFTQSLFRYGVLDNITAGIGNYVVPSINGSTSSTETYFDLAWQLTPSIYAEASKMLSTSGYALQGSISTSDNNTLQWYYDILDANNPLLQLPVSYTPLFTQSNAYKNFAVQDTYTLNKWRLLANYVNTNLQTQTQFGGSTYYNQYISPSITFGTIQPKGGNTNLQTNIYNTSALSAASIVQTFATISASANTYGGSYSYQPYGSKYNFNVSYSYSASASPSSTYGVGVNYNLSKNWFLSSNVSSNSVTVGINFSDMVTLFSKTTDPSNFATGTVYGKLLAPKLPGETTQQPLSGVEVSVGGQTAVTDTEGNYVITGVSTGTEQYLKINTNTLDASYVPALDEVPLKFRPGTVIQYNPVLNETAGLDGYLMTNDTIPPGAMIVAKRQDNSGFYRVAKVSPDDGSFEFYTLTPGTYSLEVEGVDNPPAPIKAVISPQKDWLSNVLIYWKMAKVADNSAGVNAQ